ncbi:MAG: cytochrome c oxidase subunit II, partial [Myxococcales bacterium]
VITWGLIFYAIIRYRRRDPNEIPVQTRYNLPIEIFYTIAPVVMVIVFFFFTVKAQNASFHNYEKPDRVITVVGQQWSWTFNYNLDYDKKSREFGEAAVGGDVVYDAGTTADRPTLYLVEGEKTQFNLYSPDVIHSFWVPSFLFKLDIVPGRINTFGVTPSREGTFEGRCAELCGVYHSRMLFDVKVVSKAEFDQHMAKLEDEGNTGPALGGADVNIQDGLEPASEGSHE